MRFAMAYSCGKDSTLALHKMIRAGHAPVCLLTMFNQDQQRSWFHGADAAMLKAYERALRIPLLAVAASGDDYAGAFERSLRAAREDGLEACAFGDIDFESNRTWEEERCQNLGLKAMFPLWQMEREAIIGELLDEGYKCVIKTINTRKFPDASREAIDALCKSYLGAWLDNSFLEAVASLGGDICGENGEYHTLAVDGPIFHQPLAYRLGPVLPMPGHVTIGVDFS